MLATIDLQQLLILDIETVPLKASFAELSVRMQDLWEHKVKNSIKEGETAADVYRQAALYAEFGQIICISVGVFHRSAGQLALRIKSFANHDERILLSEFSSLLLRQPANLLLCAHNGKEFDFPYLCRRLLINRLPIPAVLDISGKKPWEINHIDTLEIWKFGDFKSRISLDLMAEVLGIPTSKDDITGADVSRVYYEENNLERIQVYCQKDVVTTAQILLALKNEELIKKEYISYA